MKHIKYFKESQQVEDLADCLQEIFDKYDLKELTDMTTSNYLELLHLNHNKLHNKWYMSNDGDHNLCNNSDDFIIINTLKMGVYNEIIDNQSSIEKRLGKKIEVGDYDYFIAISIIDTNEVY